MTVFTYYSVRFSPSWRQHLATPGTRRVVPPPPLEERSMDAEIHVAYDSDFDITDESDDSDFCFETDDRHRRDDFPA